MARAGRGAKLFKQIREAGEFSRTGAVVINDGEAAIHFLWGQPSHAWVREDGKLDEGEAALKVIALRLREPRRVVWKNDDVMPTETLHCTAEELEHTLVRLGEAPTAPPQQPARSPGMAEVDDDAGEAVGYSLIDFPLLPAGSSLWSDVPAESVNLDLLLASLVTALLRYRAERTLGAAIVSDGVLCDGIFVDHTGMRTGGAAVAALRAAREGSLSAYEVEPALAEALPTLWRSTLLHRDIDTRWIDSEGFIDALRHDGEDRAVVVVTASAAGVALLSRGEVVAVYTSRNPTPTRLLGELHAMTNGVEDALVSVLERREAVEEERFVAVLDEPADSAELEADMADARAMFDPGPRRGQVSVAGGQAGPPPAAAPALPGAPAAVPVAAVPVAAPMNYTGVITELVEMSRRFLGADAMALEPVLRGADPSVPGLRAALLMVRGVEVPNHDALQVRSMVHAMQLFVADAAPMTV